MKRIAAFACLLLALAICACSNSSGDNKERHYLRALEYIKQNNDKTAVLELQNSIQIDPKFADARYQLALLHLKKGDVRTALQELERVTSLDPKNLDATIKTAELYLVSRQTKESRAIIDKALQIDPQYVDGLIVLATLDLIDGNYNGAEKAVKTAIDKAGETDRLLNIKGRIAAAQNKADEAEAAFKKAVSVSPDHFPNYQTLFQYYQTVGQEDKAKALLTEISEKFTNSQQAETLFADYYLRHNQPEKAEAALRRNIELAPDSTPNRLRLADFFIKREQLPEAETFLTECVHRFPDVLELKLALADVKFDQNKIDGAKKLMEEILKVNPAHGGGKYIQAKILLSNGKYQEARDILRSLTENYPKWAEPFYFLALAHLRQGEMDQAQKACSTALQLNPGNSKFHTLQSQLCLRTGDGEGTTKEAAVAIRIQPRNYEAQKLLAKGLLMQKKYGDSLKVVDDILARVPNDPELYSIRATISIAIQKPEEAISALNALLKLRPEDTDALRELVSLLYPNQFDKQIEAVRQYMDANKPTSGHQQILGDLLMRQQKFDDALRAYDTALQLDSGNHSALIHRSQLLFAMGQRDEAMKIFEEILATDSDNFNANIQLATMREVCGQNAEAMKLYKKVLELQPSNTYAANNLAWLMSQSEETDLGEALRLAMQAKQELPDDPNVADTLGWIYYKRGSFPMAITQFEAALSKQPENRNIMYHKAMARYGSGDKTGAIRELNELLQSGKPFHEREAAQKSLAAMAAL